MGWLFKKKKKRIVGGSSSNRSDLRASLVRKIDYVNYDSNHILKSIKIASENFNRYAKNKLNETLVKCYERIPIFVEKFGSNEEKEILSRCYGKNDPYSLSIIYLLHLRVHNRMDSLLRESQPKWPETLEISTIIDDFGMKNEHEIIEKYVEPLIEICSEFKDIFDELGYSIDIYRE